MDASGWLVGLGIAGLAAAAGAWAWFRQRRVVAELAHRLEESEHSRMDLEAHAHQVDNELASINEALARQQAALSTARMLPGATSAAVSPVQALLLHLGDTAPVASDPAASDWPDTEASMGMDDPHQDSQHPDFAETLPGEPVGSSAR